MQGLDHNRYVRCGLFPRPTSPSREGRGATVVEINCLPHTFYFFSDTSFLEVECIHDHAGHRPAPRTRRVIESYIDGKHDLYSHLSRFACDDACPRYGCKTDLVVSVIRWRSTAGPFSEEVRP